MKYLLLLLLSFMSFVMNAAPLVTNTQWNNALPIVSYANYGPNINTPAIFPPIVASSKAGYYGIVYYFPAGTYASYDYYGALNGGMVPITTSDTWQTMADKFTARYGSSGTLTQGTVLYLSDTARDAMQYCMGIMNCASCGRDEGTLQPGSCSRVTVSPASCNINDQLSIDHGPMDVSQINGHTATTSATIACDRPVTIGLRNVNPIADLGHGVTSTLSINGSINPAALNIVSSQLISISSTLSASSPTPGVLQGSSIVILDIP